ncbi:trans-3-hydroxy-L-proline dehydratase isoform X1 [Sphaerodactylus townsendi]|uniref:trans-3-hydroxy-L-proline dehydratase isoform X1 n=1 Tax=Sphaerodactylus townsendi TaxID=933632 RepID=UPI002026770A|nr:trans-3-hydroxy-L-proline dehydratase isoform X1 [Sphaerodactylus townsendi]
MAARADWLPPRAPDGPVIRTVEMHAGGEPLRVVLPGGVPGLEPEGGLSVLALRRRLLASPELDRLRRLLMHEPRGHRDMYGALLVRDASLEAAAGALFVHNEGASSMCGHAVLCLGRLALDYGLCPPRPTGSGEAPVILRCPCGPVVAMVPWDGQRSGSRVRFHSVPAFVSVTNLPVDVPGYGKVMVDVAYGGAFYAFLSAETLNLDVCSSKLRDLVDAASAVTEAVKAQFKVCHPLIEDMNFIYGTILTDGKDAFSDEPTSNICVFADAQVDRSPTGSGVTARIALQYHKGLIQLRQTRTFRSSTTGSLFTGKAVQEAKCGDHKAVIVEVSGESFYTGTSTFTIEENDPLKYGFLLK